MPQETLTFQQQFPQLFQQALALQQEKKWDDALIKYKEILDQSHNSLSNNQGSVIYHNMSVCAFEKADFINAFIWSKKAVSLDASNAFAKNLFQQVTTKFQPVQVPHQISTVESLQKIVLKDITLDLLLISFLIFLGISLFMGLKLWFVQKKNRLESEMSSIRLKKPLSLIVGFSSLLAVSAILLFLVIIKWSDLTVPKAIIAVNNTPVQTASGGNQAVIYEASVGLEVDILKMQDNYVQIRYPGAFSGWVEKKNLEILSSPTWPN